MIPLVEADPDKNNNGGLQGVAVDSKGVVYSAHELRPASEGRGRNRHCGSL